MQDGLIKNALEKNDRSGERAIAVFQALVALIVFGFHIVSAWQNKWETFSSFTIIIAITILIACWWRVQFSKLEPLNNFALHILSVIDGLLIFVLIMSYSFAYQLPLETFLKAPSLIFLVLYTAVRVLRFDPIPILVAGFTVITGWLSMLAFVVSNGAPITHSYAEFIQTDKVLIGASIEMAVGYAAVVIVLAMATLNARRFIANTAHIEELADAKHAAEDNLASLESIITSSIDGILIIDEEGNILRTNPALEKLFGYTRFELENGNAAMLMNEHNSQRLKDGLKAHNKTGEGALIGSQFESFAIHKNGSTFPIELSINKFHAGDKICFAGFIRDISERRSIQKSEKRANLRFEESVTTSLDAIIMINEQGDVILFNPAAEKLFGYSLDEVKGKDMGDLIIPEKYRSTHNEDIKHYLETGEGSFANNRIEIEGIHKNGTVFDMELAIKDIQGPAGKLFIGYARDITKRKQSEKDLLEAKINAEVANRAKASFLAMISHEIRTPLNGVLGILGLLDDGSLNTTQKKLIKTANRSGRSLMNIINDVLNFSKLEAGKLELETTSFMIDPLADSVISLLRTSANDKSIELSYSINKNVPKLLFGDIDRIRQILLNLAANAVKFTEKGSVKISIENIGTKEKPVIRFLIKDTGIGIPKEKHNLIFSEFTTIDASNTRKFGGTGLGLAISKALVSAMKGTIDFKSGKDKGASFWFDIPLKIGKASRFDEKTEQSEIALTREEQKTRILIAEDNATNQLIVSIMLERLGCSFEIASDGREALNAVKDRDFDLVLMDVSMPEMDGIEATKAIRKLKGKKSKVKIVALTAYAFDEDRQRVIAAGMDDFIAKPVSRTDLARVIAKSSSASTGSIESDNQIENTLLFNLDTIMPILEGLDDETIKTVFTEFNNDISKYEKSAKTAKSTSDLELLERSSHGLKGVAGMFGADELNRIAEQINTKCRTGTIEFSDKKISEMISLCKKVKASALVLKNSLDV